MTHDEQKQPSSSSPASDATGEPIVSNRDSEDHLFSSESLIPHPETHAGPLSSHLPEPDAPTSEYVSGLDRNTSIQLTAELFASGTLPVGTMLGHYMIKSFIGGGGMGRVYLATDTALDRNVAIKVLPRQRAKDQATVARFMNEAKSAARLNHEHIAQVYFAGEQAGIPYIVFEYVEGTNIRALVDDYDAFPLPQALNYLIQIAHALSHAAEHGVVHRDVKPSNILITREGRAKLIDMGLARLLDPSVPQDDLTASGVTLGTFDYISPEQARDPRNADIRSDIYSLGCTFFFMLSGRPPFPEGTVLQKLLQHQGDEPPDIRAFQPNVPPEVAVLIQKMMAKDPKLRFQTPTALIEALVNVAKMIGLQPTGPGKLIWVMNPPSKTSQLLRHLPWISAILLLMLIFFPLNLYWKQLGGLDPPAMPSGAGFESPMESSIIQGSDGTTLPPSTANDTVEATDRTNAANLTLITDERYDRDVYRMILADGEGGSEITEENPISARWSGWNRFHSGVAATSMTAHWAPEGHQNTVARLTGHISPVQTSAGTSSSVKPSDSVASEPSVLCVDPSGETPDAYMTLETAIAAAMPGSTIELKWDGPRKVDPLVLTDRQLTIAAYENHFPMLSFEPSDATSFTLNSRSMITTRSSQLTFRDIAIEMGIRQDDMGLRWTLFELIGAKNKLRFSRCVLTVCNAASDNSAYHREVAFFRNNVLPIEFEQIVLTSGGSTNTVEAASVSSAGEAGGGVSGTETANREGDESLLKSRSSGKDDRPTIRMTDSILRGEATGLQCDVLQAIEFRAENSLIMLAKSFVQTEDSRRTTRPEPIRLQFDHVTLFSRSAFSRQYRHSFETEPMPLEVEARYSIFFLNNAPFVELRGARMMQDAFDAFRWSGRSNYFQSVTLGVRIRSATSNTDAGVTYDYDIPLSEWRDRANSAMENDVTRSTKIDRLIFNEIRKPTHRLLPGDLVPKHVETGLESEGEAMPGVSMDRLVRPALSWTRSE